MEEFQVMSESTLAKLESDWKCEASLKKMQENWTEFEKWCGKLRTEQQAPVKEMLSHFEERAFTAPASSRFEFHNAFPGGFIDHSLRVMKHTVKLTEAWKVQVDPASLIMATLFHDWGKVGTKEDDYYLPEESGWHRQRGKIYNKNPKVKMPNAQLGLFVLSQFGVPLNEEEYCAILLNDGQYSESNREYGMKEPKLALLVHMADRWSSQCEKGRKTLIEAASPRF